MSNLKLMQIGDRSFHVHEQTIFHSYSNESEGKEQKMAFSPYKSITNSQWLYRTQSLKVDGEHVSTQPYDVDQITQELRNWVGKPTVIIAYIIASNRPEAKGFNCACNCAVECPDCQLVYLQNFGVLESVRTDQSDPFQPPQLSLEIKLFEFWRELDTYTWKWGSGVNRYPLPKTYGDDEIIYLPIQGECGGEAYYNPPPTCAELFQRDTICGSFEFVDWEDDSLYYDELFWDEQYNNDCFKREGGQSGICALAPKNLVTVDTHIGTWGAPPLSIYSFSNLPASGTLSIIVRRKNGLSLEEVISTIDLEQLDDDLSDDGYTGLEFNDRLIVGDIRRYFDGQTYRPSFVQRDCEILTTRPRWAYSDWFPGMLYPGVNKFAFDYSGSGDATAIVASYIHHFRRV